MITLRILQRFSVQDEADFLALEKQFADLEINRPDLPKGKRSKPISAAEPVNTLIWEADFPDLAAAQAALDLFAADPEHEILFRQQCPFIEQVKIEFYQKLIF
jgi:hypothetical protein